MAGEVDPPPCFTCKSFYKRETKSTHVSKRITPAGYHSYQCNKHAIDEKPSSLWGSDPGWLTTYETIPKMK